MRPKEVSFTPCHHGGMQTHKFQRVSLGTNEDSNLSNESNDSSFDQERGAPDLLPRFSFESDCRSDISVETGALLGIFDMSFGVSRSNTQRTSKCTEQMSMIDHTQSMDKEDPNLVRSASASLSGFAVY